MAVEKMKLEAKIPNVLNVDIDYFPKEDIVKAHTVEMVW
jgi:hypothetical protein